MIFLPAIIIDDVEPVIVDDEKVVESRNLVDKLIVAKKPSVAENKARAKKGKGKNILQVFTIIPRPPPLFLQRIRKKQKRESITCLSLY